MDFASSSVRSVNAERAALELLEAAEGTPVPVTVLGGRAPHRTHTTALAALRRAA